MVKSPVFLTGEIVQIGAVKLDPSFKVADSFNQRVSPLHYREIHPHVSDVTGLTTGDLRRGRTFPEVFAEFCDWCGEEFVFLIWGTEDLRILRKNMELHDIDTSYMPRCYNLQNLFAAQITKDTRQYGLSKALALVKETPFDAHDALNDAKSTVLLCNHLDMAKGLAEYREITEHKDGIVESYIFDDPYADVNDALDDDYVVSFECPECGEIVWGDDWVRKTSLILLSPCSCCDGREFMIKLKFQAIPNQQVIVKRFVHIMTDELRAEYQACKEQAEAWNQYVIPAYPTITV
jgi:inhibitor of KinA sporulation pathway (predicted exonuclease)/predicted RNA-binding Zn-ribbon protein involved in translation (DUF1610 family)